jgi:hypothetical protein
MARHRSAGPRVHDAAAQVLKLMARLAAAADTFDAARGSLSGSACGMNGPECSPRAPPLDSHTRRNDVGAARAEPHVSALGWGVLAALARRGMSMVHPRASDTPRWWHTPRGWLWREPAAVCVARPSGS